MSSISPTNPVLGDTITFVLDTPDGTGCMPAHAQNQTYLVNNVTIYFIERGFEHLSTQVYDLQLRNEAADKAAAAAKAVACQIPTVDNQEKYAALQAIADSMASTQPYYYKDAVAVAVFDSPWVSSDPADSLLVPATDSGGNPIFGSFALEWETRGIREGDYFICWTWSPLPAGSTLSAHMPFYLLSNTKVNTSIPTQVTNPSKYVTLFDRYTPEMFKMMLGVKDQSPDVIERYHASVASLFTDVENLSNQLIALFDANAIQEAMLPYLSNLFNLKLRSDDATLWRRQTRNAIPNFKSKGTLAGLTNALSQCGATLNKVHTLWQVTSSHTWTDQFLVADETSFALSRVGSYDPNNFSLLLRPVGETTYRSLAANYVSFATSQGKTTLTWLGADQTPPIVLASGDLLVIRYLVNAVPDATAQKLEDYIQQNLSLSDQRDPLEGGKLVIPLKNWNVRLIDETDPVFDLLVPVLVPFADDVIFGKVRTEFAYSENVYNMDEYDGSLRDSPEPCDIDSDFVDACTACPSTSVTLDISIDDPTDDRVNEIREVIREFLPFHARVQTLNFSGTLNDFVLPPSERVEILINARSVDNVISGGANTLFNRYRLNGYDPASIRRDMLANSVLVVPPTTGMGYNSAVVLYSTDVEFDEIGLNPSRSYLEILAPSPNSGVYQPLANPVGNTVEVPGVREPLNTSTFTYNLSNQMYSSTSVVIAQSNLVRLVDTTTDFTLLGIHLEDDGGHATIHLTWGDFVVDDILPDGSLEILDPGSAIPLGTTTVDYAVAGFGGTGKVIVTGRGLVTINDPGVPVAAQFFRNGDILRYAGQDYTIVGFPDTNQVMISDYTAGAAAGVPVTVYRRMVTNGTGYFSYKGMMLDASVDQEINLGILNGDNAPTDPNLILDNGHFFEKYLVLINSTYYSIAGINGPVLTLAGPPLNWGTTGQGKSGGTEVLYSIIWLQEVPITIDSQNFAHIDRSGDDELVEGAETTLEGNVVALGLNAARDPAFRDFMGVDERLRFEIRYVDGKIEQGEF